jgi:membrane protein DedA with SNARE-associated domain
MSPDGLHFLEHYGVVILPALAVAEQIGVPLPAVPALLAVGALAAQGRISIPLVLGAISVAALATDLAWYELGRRRGARVLARLCQLSLEPDSCLRRAESIFARHGVRAMLAAKFVPGLTTVMPPLAGVFAVARGRFVLYDLAGVLLWAGTWLALGYFFSDAIVLIAARASALGRMFGLVIATAFAGYILVKFGRRHLFLRKLWTARVSPEALKRRLDAGEDVTIIDLRTPLDCASPNDTTSARVALELKRKGITRVRPLEGGLAAWMALNFPVRPVQLPVVPAHGSPGSVQSTAA